MEELRSDPSGPELVLGTQCVRGWGETLRSKILWEIKICAILWWLERWQGRLYKLEAISLGCLLGEEVAIIISWWGVGWGRVCWGGHRCRV